jgi:K+-sensing histidine kinase KdpD
VVIDVADHGPGLGERVPSDGLGAVRASGRADRSTGLGLEIVRRFCDAMDVDVAFLATDGGGLTVRITVPMSEVSR